MKKWDSLLFMNPVSVMDSLQNFKPEKLSESNFAYFNLLSTIGSCMNDIYIIDDSYIPKTIEWYRSKNDYYNLCRSLIFCSAANFIKQLFLNDSIKFNNLGEAEELFTQNKVKDPVTEAFLNKYLAKKSIHLFHSNKSDLFPATLKAEEYINRAETLFMKLGNKREMQLSNLYLLEIVVGVYEYDKELEILNKIAGFPDLEQDIRPLLNKKFAHLHQKKVEYDKSIHYLKSVLGDSLFGISSKINKSDIINDIAVIYDIKNQPDSAIKYAILYKDLMLKDLQRSHIGYQFLAKIYENSGDYSNALDLYKRYSKYASKLFTTELKERTLQNQSEKNLLIKEIRQKKSLSNSLIIALITSLVGLVFTIIYFKSSQRRDNSKLERELDELKKHIESLEESAKKLWIINEVLKTTAGKYPDLIRDVQREAAKCRKESKGTCDNLNTIVDDARQISREMISEIAKNKYFANNFPEIFNKTELSHYEKIIYALFSLGYDAKEIANFFSVSPSTIRAVKARVKDKHD
ncbi:MAG: hypothetical protein Q8S04_08450 [Bacteroidales bacterium]|nr:hypothetical protein [Bacteroidales bacterium]